MAVGRISAVVAARWAEHLRRQQLELGYRASRADAARAMGARFAAG